MIHEMGAEEAVGGLEGILREVEVAFQEIHDPCGMAVLQTMTVGAVPHQFSIVNLSQLVNLPIDDSVVFRTSEAIAEGGVYHLATGQET
jgi:hypothetical protein